MGMAPPNVLIFLMDDMGIGDCRAYNSSSMVEMPNLEKIIVINKKKYGLHWLNIWRSCIIKKWDLVVDMRSSITAYLLFAKSRKIFKGNDSFHKIIQFTNFLNTSKKISPLIWSDFTDEAESKNKIKNEGPFIAVAPYSNWRQKDWSIEKYILSLIHI